MSSIGIGVIDGEIEYSVHDEAEKNLIREGVDAIEVYRRKWHRATRLVKPNGKEDNEDGVKIAKKKMKGLLNDSYQAREKRNDRATRHVKQDQNQRKKRADIEVVVELLFDFAEERIVRT